MAMRALRASSPVYERHTALNSAHSSARSQQLKEPSLQVVPCPGVGDQENVLRAVVALGGNKAAAVGYYKMPDPMSPTGWRLQTLAVRWDGRKWVVGRGANEHGHNRLAAVSAVPVDSGLSTVLWAVGTYKENGEPSRPLIMRSTDSGMNWKLAPFPSRFGLQSHVELAGVVALSEKNVWVVGTHNSDQFPGGETLILHWNGTLWERVPSPNPGKANTLSALCFPTHDQAWAVGSYAPAGSARWQTLILYWNGEVWQPFGPSPNVRDSANNILHAVAAGPSGEVWAAGVYYPDRQNAVPQPLTLRWKGLAWRIVECPHAGSVGGSLHGVAALDEGCALAVGAARYTGDSREVGALAMHWNGKRWRTLPLNDVAVEWSSRLAAVATSPPGNPPYGVRTIYAVGDSDNLPLTLLGT